MGEQETGQVVDREHPFDMIFGKAELRVPDGGIVDQYIDPWPLLQQRGGDPADLLLDGKVGPVKTCLVVAAFPADVRYDLSSFLRVPAYDADCGSVGGKCTGSGEAYAAGRPRDHHMLSICEVFFHASLKVRIQLQERGVLAFIVVRKRSVVPVFIGEHLRFFEGDHAATSGLVHEGIDGLQEPVDLVFVIHDFHDDRKVLGNVDQFGSVDMACRPKGHDAPEHGGSGHLLRFGRKQQGFVERLMAGLVTFSDKNAQQPRIRVQLRFHITRILRGGRRGMQPQGQLPRWRQYTGGRIKAPRPGAARRYHKQRRKRW